MPQLDKVTFLSQVFWFCLVFAFLYLILVRVFLPALARIVRVRQVLAKSAPAEKTSAQTGTTDVYTQSFDASLSSFTSYVDFLSRWNTQKLNSIVGTISPDFMDIYEDMRSENLLVEAAINNVVPPVGRGQNLVFESEVHNDMFTSQICEVIENEGNDDASSNSGFFR